MKEFIEVFFDDLLEIPLEREIDFDIDLFPDTQTISIPSYWIALAELKKLKSQLTDFLNKVSIQPNISPCGAPYCL